MPMNKYKVKLMNKCGLIKKAEDVNLLIGRSSDDVIKRISRSDTGETFVEYRNPLLSVPPGRPAMMTANKRELRVNWLLSTVSKL